MLCVLRAGLCAAVVLCGADRVVAQESAPQAAAAAAAPATDATAAATVSYVVELSEYEWREPLAAGLGADEILALVLKADARPQADLRETIRLTTLAGTESVVSFGRRSSVTVGRTATGRGEVMKNMQVVEFGTQVKLTAVPQDQRVRLTLHFESSRQLPATADDSPPDISTTEVSTTLTLDPGKPALVSSFGGNRSSVLVVMVKPQP